MHFIFMEDEKHKTRPVRYTFEPDIDDLESMTNIMLEDLVMNLAMSGETADKVSSLMEEMDTPHLVDEPSTRRNRWGLFDFLFVVVINEEAEDMQHAVKILTARQFEISDHIQSFKKCVVAVANRTNKHLPRMGIVMGRLDQRFTHLFKDYYK